MCLPGQRFTRSTARCATACRTSPRPRRRRECFRRRRNSSKARGDGRRRVGVVLESGKRNSTVGDAGVQRAAYGKTDLAGGRSGEERGQDTRIREKRARGRREHSDGDGDAGEPAGKIKEEIVRLA